MKIRVIVQCFACVCVYSLKVGRGCTTELTHQGYQFFLGLFDKYDEVNLYSHLLTQTCHHSSLPL